jgi:hypothetical protein
MHFDGTVSDTLGASPQNGGTTSEAVANLVEVFDPSYEIARNQLILD